MQMQIRTLNLDNSAALDAHARERLAAALEHFGARVDSVDARLEDMHGTRHGQEFRCTVRVHVKGAGVVMVEQVDTDLYHAMDQAAHRVKRAVKRRVNRSRSFTHERHADRRAA